MNVHDRFVSEYDRHVLLDTPRYWGHETRYRSFTTRYLKSILARAAVFVDVGAHHGFFSLLAASANNELQVIAIEPSAENREGLIRNVEKFDAGRSGAPRFTICDRAISEADGERLFNISSVSDKCGFYPHPDVPVVRRVMVETTSLDVLLSQREPAPLVIKVDAVGHELAVLRGLRDTLSRFDDVTLLLELNPRMQALAGVPPEQLVAEIEGAGFAAFIVDEGRDQSFRVNPHSDWAHFVQPDGQATLICVRKSRALCMCFFGHGAGANGAERSLVSLVKGLVGQHGTLCTVFLPETGPLEELIRDTGASCIVAPYPWWCYEPGDGRTDVSLQDDLSVGLASYATKLLPLVREIDPDVICTQTVVIPWGAAVAATLGKPHIWSVCEYGELDHGLRFEPSFQAIASDIEQGSDYIFFNAKDIKTTLFHNLAEHRWDVLYRHVEIGSSWDVADVVSPSARPLQLIIVGTLAAAKGQADAIAALALLKERGLAAELTVVGAGNADYVAELRRRVAELGLENEVHFVDFTMNPFPLVGKSDIALVCSRREAFGRVAVEAMLLGKPVVYAAAGGITEYMRDGETGLGYQPGDTTALADRIEVLIRDAGLRMRMGAAAQAHARATFSRDEFAGKFYRKALELRGSPSIARFPAALLPSIEKALGAVEKLKADKAATETSLAGVRLDAEVVSATLGERTTQLAEAPNWGTSLEASAVGPALLDERRLRTALGVKLRAAWRHPRNSHKRKVYRARHVWAPPPCESMPPSSFGRKLRALFRHPFSSRSRKLYRAGEQDREQGWKPHGLRQSYRLRIEYYLLQMLMRQNWLFSARRLQKFRKSWHKRASQRSSIAWLHEPPQDNGSAHRLASPRALQPHPEVPDLHPAGFRAEILAKLRPFDDVIAEWRRRPRIFRQLHRDSLLTALQASVPSGTHCVLSFSQDNYRANVGGIQLCVLLEEEAFRRADTSYIHLSPFQPLPALATATSPVDYKFSISLNGKFLGHVLASDLIHALASQKENGVHHKLVVHSLLGHSPELVAALCRALGLSQGIYWLHDYFSLCPNYTLMRNTVSYCGAPPSSSQACQICHVGAHRTPHLDRIRRFFSEIDFTLVAPSASALSIWQEGADLPVRATIVQEHCNLERNTASRPNLTRLSGPLRVAFLGFPSVHKGWEVFREVVELCDTDDIYTFYHIGKSRPTLPLKGVTFLHAEATTIDRYAMSKAMSSNRIDVAFLCSLWPETYNFTALETLAGGALIVTLASSGNVAALVQKFERGLVFDNEAELKTAFTTGALASEIRKMQRRNPSDYRYTFSGMGAQVFG